jgi:hypothetical protein
MVTVDFVSAFLRGNDEDRDVGQVRQKDSDLNERQ